MKIIRRMNADGTGPWMISFGVLWVFWMGLGYEDSSFDLKWWRFRFSREQEKRWTATHVVSIGGLFVSYLVPTIFESGSLYRYNRSKLINEPSRKIDGFGQDISILDVMSFDAELIDGRTE